MTLFQYISTTCSAILKCIVSMHLWIKSKSLFINQLQNSVWRLVFKAWSWPQCRFRSSTRLSKSRNWTSVSNWVNILNKSNMRHESQDEIWRSTQPFYTTNCPKIEAQITEIKVMTIAEQLSSGYVALPYSSPIILDVWEAPPMQDTHRQILDCSNIWTLFDS